MVPMHAQKRMEAFHERAPLSACGHPLPALRGEGRERGANLVHGPNARFWNRGGSPRTWKLGSHLGLKPTGTLPESVAACIAMLNPGKWNHVIAA